MAFKTFQAVDMKANVPQRMVTFYAATWKPDLVGDIIEKGAFAKTIAARGPRETDKGIRSKIKLKLQHKELIGIPVKLTEDSKGLLVQARITETDIGDRVLKMVEDGTLDQASIGYRVVRSGFDPETGLRVLKELALDETSLVDGPANEDTDVLSVKQRKEEEDMDGYGRRILMALGSALKAVEGSWKVGGKSGLPLADADRAWDAMKAEASIREWAGGDDDMDWAKYRQGFALYDSGDPEAIGSYKLPFAEVVDGKLQAVPKGVAAAAAALQGGRGGVSAPDDAQEAARSFLAGYYKAMAKDPPWKKSMDAVSSQLEMLATETKELKCGGYYDSSPNPWVADVASRLMAAASTLTRASYWSMDGDIPEPPDAVILAAIVDILRDVTASVAGLETKAGPTPGEAKVGRRLSTASTSLIQKAIEALQKLMDGMSECEGEDCEDDGKSLSPAEQKALEDAAATVRSLTDEVLTMTGIKA